jgi:hypothetical protein
MLTKKLNNKENQSKKCLVHRAQIINVKYNIQTGYSNDPYHRDVSSASALRAHSH